MFPLKIGDVQGLCLFTRGYMIMLYNGIVKFTITHSYNGKGHLRSTFLAIVKL